MIPDPPRRDPQVSTISAIGASDSPTPVDLAYRYGPLISARIRAAREVRPTPAQRQHLQLGILAAIAAIPSSVPPAGPSEPLSPAAGGDATAVAPGSGGVTSLAGAVPGAATTTLGLSSATTALALKVALALIPAALLAGVGLGMKYHSVLPGADAPATRAATTNMLGANASAPALPDTAPRLAPRLAPREAAPDSEIFDSHEAANPVPSAPRSKANGLRSGRRTVSPAGSQPSPTENAPAAAGSSQGNPTTTTPGGFSQPNDIELIRKAQRSLQSSPEEALRLAGEYEERNPQGQMEQDAERIAILALVRLQRLGPARARAERFGVRYPGSAYWDGLRGAVDLP